MVDLGERLGNVLAVPLVGDGQPLLGVDVEERDRALFPGGFRTRHDCREADSSGKGGNGAEKASCIWTQGLPP